MRRLGGSSGGVTSITRWVLHVGDKTRKGETKWRDAQLQCTIESQTVDGMYEHDDDEMMMMMKHKFV